MATTAVKFGLVAVVLDAFLGFASRGVMALIFFLTIVLSGFAQQAHPQILQITSPVDGTVVHPGQTIAVTVVPTTGDALTGVSLIGETPFGLTPAVTTPPYRFSITVPDPLTIRAGKYRLTAVGGMPGGQPFANSAPITIDVEPSAEITNLRVEPKIVLLQRPTDGVTLSVFGTFADGATMRIDHSTAITYTALATGDFTVTSTGVIRAGPMKRTITGMVIIQFAGRKASVAVNCDPPTDPNPPSAGSSLSPSSNAKGLAQGPPLLQITSPADGTVVHPGDTVTVVVTPASGVTFMMVALFAEGDLAKDLVLASPPYHFSLTVPNNISARNYQVTADGATSPGQGGASPPISLDVEPGAPCAKIAVEPYHIELEAVELPYGLEVSCIFADGASMDITHSTQTKYKSFNTSVATVDQNGQVRLVGPGMTTVMANFNGQMEGTLIEVAKAKPAVPRGAR